MENAFSDFNSLELFFLFCAVQGGFFVAMKTVMQFVGGDADSDFGAADGDMDFNVLKHLLNYWFTGNEGR